MAVALLVRETPQVPAIHPDHIGLDSIRFHSDGLAALVADSALDVAVPTCGDWTLGDLAWHMTEVQDFWAYVIPSRPAPPAEYIEPNRPSDAAVVGRLEQATSDLLAALVDADPIDEAWSWASEQTVAFTLRRQSHEVLIHHIDAVLALGAAMPDISPELAADGVDEAVEVFLSEIPSWASFTRSDGVVRLDATDTGDSWVLVFGQMTGTSPRTGKHHDMEALVIAEGESPDTVVAARAVELDLWMWGRADADELTVTGDRSMVDRFRASVVRSTQ